MIIIDTTVLVYAKGHEHPLREPCVALIEAIAQGTVEATTTPEVIQEFVHVRARRRPRQDAADLGRAFTDLLSPLLAIEESHLMAGLQLFERNSSVGAFDAALAALVIDSGAAALVSADRTFATLRGVTHVQPGTRAFDRLLAH